MAAGGCCSSTQLPSPPPARVLLACSRGHAGVAICYAAKNSIAHRAAAVRQRRALAAVPRPPPPLPRPPQHCPSTAALRAAAHAQQAQPPLTPLPQDSQGQPTLPRRQLLALATCAAAAALTPARPAAASGILQLPIDKLSNTYFLVRAGQSEAEAAGYVLTNPVSKTSTTAGLSQNGKRQIVKQTYPALRELGLDSSCWIWPSITQNAYQTAEVLAALHGVGRNRIVPEFSFLDARGVGELERLPVSEVAAALEAGDSLAPTWRPAPNVDGTVHESSADVLVRVRQLLSLLETQYNGDTVIIVSPDSDNLSVLQAAVLGVDLRSHHQYAFAPGEARLLELATGERPEPPTSFACPRPPQCI